jgi:hypothetical protein
MEHTKTELASIYELLKKLNLPSTPENTKTLAIVYSKLENLYAELDKKDEPEEPKDE